MNFSSSYKVQIPTEIWYNTYEFIESKPYHQKHGSLKSKALAYDMETSYWTEVTTGNKKKSEGGNGNLCPKFRKLHRINNNNMGLSKNRRALPIFFFFFNHYYYCYSWPPCYECLKNEYSFPDLFPFITRSNKQNP